MAAAGKYLWSCHGTRPRLRILFKQSLSEHQEGDGDTVSLRLPCGPLSQHHTLGKQWSHAGTGAARLKIAEQGLWRVTRAGTGGELGCGSPGLGLRMELVDWDSKRRKNLAEHQELEGCSLKQQEEFSYSCEFKFVGKFYSDHTYEITDSNYLNKFKHFKTKFMALRLVLSFKHIIVALTFTQDVPANCDC